MIWVPVSSPRRGSPFRAIVSPYVAYRSSSSRRVAAAASDHPGHSNYIALVIANRGASTFGPWGELRKGRTQKKRPGGDPRVSSMGKDGVGRSRYTTFLVKAASTGL